MIGASDIRSIEPLTSIQYMDGLHLPGSYNLTSLEGIQKLTNLQQVQLKNCPNIEDFTPLLALPDLKELIVSPDMQGRVSAQLAGADFEIRYEEEGV
jgi:Leucine-rich repeat (LRR) protein